MTMQFQPDLFAKNGDPHVDELARQAWRDLVGSRLPAAACRRNWPIHLDHCFARVLLDNAIGRPWREVVGSPAWRNTPLTVLQKAIALGEAVLAGEADLWDLNNRSLALRQRPAPRTVLVGHSSPHA
jgi:hypothetical protein